MALVFTTTTSIAALDNTNLIQPLQWQALGRLSLRSGRTIEQLLSSFTIEAVDAERSDAIRLVGRIDCSPTYHLYGCIDSDGSTHT